MSPLLPHTAYSAALRKRQGPLGRPAGLIHGNTPRQVAPAVCSASVVLGSCRQSVNSTIGAPGLATRRHSDSHSVTHSVQLRWSRLSPLKLRCSRFTSLPTYLDTVDCCVRAVMCRPPELYGGS